jgi:hypothetical protein
MPKILWHRTVVRDGWHNASTDLCFWKNSYWLAFRKGSAHVSPDGGIVILRSVDLERWHEAAFIKTVGDDRDPKLCPTEEGLHVYFGTWLPKPKEWPDEEFGPLFSHVCVTRDGVHWSDPIPIYRQNMWLWRVRFHRGYFYSAAYGWEDPKEKHRSFLDLLMSQDGFNWRRISRIADIEDQPNEADIFFHSNEELWCIARSSRNPDHSLLYVSQPPCEKWSRMDLKTTIHCPVFCETGGRLYVAGRRRTNTIWRIQLTPPGNTGIFLVERKEITPFFALPSDGDAAYPGLISREPGKLLISYYSQHAYLSGVLQGASPHSSDIYIAEIYSEDSPMD